MTPDPVNRIGADPASGRAAATIAQLSLGIESAGSAMREEATQAGSGNFRLAVPAVRLPGRGLDLALDLTYNSGLWSKRGGIIRFDVGAGWPAPGWSLGFGKLYARHWTGPGGHAQERLSMLVEPDGTTHTAQWDGEGDGFLSCSGAGNRIVSWHTTDGSRIDYQYRLFEGRASCGVAKYPNGTVVLYTAPGGSRRGYELYPTLITDRNGNQINIFYRDGFGPEIATITDTLGRNITFDYERVGAGDFRLIGIRGPAYGAGTAGGEPRTFVRLHYAKRTPPKGAFRGLQVEMPGANNSNVRMRAGERIDAIYYPGFPGPGVRTGYWFGDPDSYSHYGMLKKVSYRRAMICDCPSLTEQGTIPANGMGLVTRELVYDYPVGDPGDPPLTEAPTYTTMTETWVEKLPSAPDLMRSAVTRYDVRQNEIPRRVEITRPDRTKVIEFSYRDKRPGIGPAIVGLADKCLEEDEDLHPTTWFVVMRHCNGEASQRWRLTNGQIVGPPSWCLDVDSPNPADGTRPIILLPCENGRASQLWRLSDDGRIIGLNDKCLDVEGANPASGTFIILWDCHGRPNQRWNAGISGFLDGLPYERQLRDPAGNLLQKTTTHWFVSTELWTPVRGRVEVTDYLVDRAARPTSNGQTRTTEFKYGRRDQITELCEYDYGPARDSIPSCVDDGTLLRRTRTVYLDDVEDQKYGSAGSHIFGLPTMVEIYAHRGGVVPGVLMSRTHYRYDTQPLKSAPGVVQSSDWPTSRGNLTLITSFTRIARSSDPTDLSTAIVGSTGKCLDVEGANPVTGTPIILWDCHGGANQRWRPAADSTIVGLAGKCLDVEGENPTSGSRIVLWDCQSTASQSWSLEADGRIRGLAGKCLDVEGGTPASGARIVLWDCQSAASQNWVLGDTRTEQRRYDVTGNLIEVTGAECCELESFEYTVATQYAYPTKHTRGARDPNSPARVTDTARYDFNTGVTLATTDANGRTSDIHYYSDTNRPSTIWLPKTAGPSPRAFVSYEYDDDALTVTETTRSVSNTGPQKVHAKSVQQLNGLGLISRREALAKEIEGGEEWDAVDAWYDFLGPVSFQTQPFRVIRKPGQPSQEPPADEKKWSNIAYDAAGRPTLAVAPDGGKTLWFYDEEARPSGAPAWPGQTVRTVDAAARERWSLADAGGLRAIVEPNPEGEGSVFEPGHLVTYYNYDGLGRTNIVRQGDQVRIFMYDQLGRLTHVRLPEKDRTLDEAGNYVGSAGSDSDVFAYDARSNLISHADARGVKTIYDYGNDPLNRLQTVTYDVSGVPGNASSPVLPAPTVRYEYMPNGDPTRLYKLSVEGVSSEEYGYDSEGRLDTKTFKLVELPDHSFVTTYRYDDLDRVTQITYPARYGAAGAPRRMLQADHDMAGRMSRLCQLKPAASPPDSCSPESIEVDFVPSIAYDEAGRVKSLLLGASGPYQLTESYYYDPAMGVLIDQSVKREETALLDLSYSYGKPGSSIGLLRSITDNVLRPTPTLPQPKSRLVSHYDYDALGRLKRWGRELQAPESPVGEPSDQVWEQGYGYDRYGNRTQTHRWQTWPEAGMPDRPDGIAKLTPDPTTNRIKHIEPYPNESVGYDAAGNITRQLHWIGVGLWEDKGAIPWWTYQYDAAGRLAKVLRDVRKDDDSTVAEEVEVYTYGADRRRLITDRRLWLSHPGRPSNRGTQRTYHIWDGDAVVAEYEDWVGPPANVRWTKDNVYLGGRLVATVAPGGIADAVTMTASDGRLYAVGGDGLLRWRPATADQSAWQDIGEADGVVALAVADGRLYAATRDDAVTGDGRLLSRPATTDPSATWEKIGDSPGILAMTAAGDQLLAYDRNNKLLLRSLANGSLWDPSPGGEAHEERVAAMAATDNTLFVLLINGELWAQSLPLPSASHFAGVASGAVALAVSDGKLFAADRDEGLRWRPASQEPMALQDVNGTGELVRYHHSDRLGTRLITKATRTEARRQATLPFGAISESESSYGPSDWVVRSEVTVDDMNSGSSRLFTSYDRSARIGLDYAVNRQYDPQQGRFLQPDPLGIAASDLTDPQSLNLYAYVQNDPLNATDPTGLLYCIFCTVWGHRVPSSGSSFYDIVDLYGSHAIKVIVRDAPDPSGDGWGEPRVPGWGGPEGVGVGPNSPSEWQEYLIALKARNAALRDRVEVAGLGYADDGGSAGGPGIYGSMFRMVAQAVLAAAPNAAGGKPPTPRINPSWWSSTTRNVIRAINHVIDMLLQTNSPTPPPPPEPPAIIRKAKPPMIGGPPGTGVIPWFVVPTISRPRCTPENPEACTL